ncbi:MAG: hypothetical protein PGMFKBFP_00790 [Anaerolineales bacterium]|nr:hypothetical protein [Anaerolineales bacterium]
MPRKHTSNKQRETCYMCDMPATSREHVPPRCFFPEQKDVGKNYRKNLLAVPSCDLHNSEKSKDDEYVQFVITIHYENYPVAQQQFSTKIMRAVRRKPSMFGFLKNLFPITVFGKPSAAFSVDRERFDREIDHIARALYFFHHNSKLEFPITVHTPDLFMVNQPNANLVNQQNHKIEGMTVDAVSDQPVYGENREIFSYQFRDLEEVSGFVMRMVFYGGFVVIAYASPSVSI